MMNNNDVYWKIGNKLIYLSVLSVYDYYSCDLDLGARYPSKYMVPKT